MIQNDTFLSENGNPLTLANGCPRASEDFLQDGCCPPGSGQFRASWFWLAPPGSGDQKSPIPLFPLVCLPRQTAVPSVGPPGARVPDIASVWLEVAVHTLLLLCMFKPDTLADTGLG